MINQLNADNVENNYIYYQLNYNGDPTMNLHQNIRIENDSLLECLTPPLSVNSIDYLHQDQMFKGMQQQKQQLPVDCQGNYSYCNVRSGQVIVEQNADDNNQNIQHSIDATTAHNVTASTIEEDDIEAKYTPCEGPFASLQGLDSGNLMQLSQQSSVQRMLVDEHIRNKPKINLPPTLEEHDEGNYNFRINVQAKGPQIRGNKSNAVYSENLNKLYIKKKENVYIDVYYTLKIPIQPLRVRTFMVFSKDPNEPVLRCQNHICEDNNENIKIRHSMLRCEHEDVEYCGSETGKYIKDRYSVVIPLDTYVKSTDGENQVKQQLLLNFSCNNSCMGRRETSAIFLLETMSGEILAQRVLHVKVCTCPRRDKRIEEMPPKGNRKRKANNEYNIESKTLKLDSSSMNTDYSRSSSEEVSGYGSDGSRYKAHQEKNGEVVMTLRYKNGESALNLVKLLFVDIQMREFFYDIPMERKEFWDLYQKVKHFK
uniref:p53 DNA-binding domain-containing protein n=1 Tax=Glossina brevipalpis TaxID=37001 RepID=A0A1A9W1P0_9MUSC